jgi:hypothetical protein
MTTYDQFWSLMVADSRTLYTQKKRDLNQISLLYFKIQSLT